MNLRREARGISTFPLVRSLPCSPHFSRFFNPHRSIPLSRSSQSRGTTRWKRSSGTRAGRKAEHKRRRTAAVAREAKEGKPLRNTIFAVSSSFAHSWTIPRDLECSITAVRSHWPRKCRAARSFSTNYSKGERLLRLKRRKLWSGWTSPLNIYSFRAISPSRVVVSCRSSDISFPRSSQSFGSRNKFYRRRGVTKGRFFSASSKGMGIAN